MPSAFWKFVLVIITLFALSWEPSPEIGFIINELYSIFIGGLLLGGLVAAIALVVKRTIDNPVRGGDIIALVALCSLLYALLR